MYTSSRVQSTVEHLTLLNPFSNEGNLPEILRPRESQIPRDKDILEQLTSIQTLLNQLSYNFLPQTFFNLEKQRALQSILTTGKEVIIDALPIRCLEATFVGIYLTQELKDLERIPLSFKSRANGQSHHHIVLAIKYNGLYGALGLSRQATLMDKPITFTSLVDLIEDYRACYQKVGHELIMIRIGLYVSHDFHSSRIPCWRFVTLNIRDPPLTATSDVGAIICNLEKMLPLLSEQYQILPLQQVASTRSATPSRSTASTVSQPASSVTNRKSTTRPQLQGSKTNKQAGTGHPASSQVEGQAKPGSSTNANGLATEDDSKVENEENARRISALVKMVSPWAQDSASGSKKAVGKGRLTPTPQRLRGAAQSCGAGSSAISATPSQGTESPAGGATTSAVGAAVGSANTGMYPPGLSIGSNTPSSDEGRSLLLSGDHTARRLLLTNAPREGTESSSSTKRVRAHTVGRTSTRSLRRESNNSSVTRSRKASRSPGSFRGRSDSLLDHLLDDRHPSPLRSRRNDRSQCGPLDDDEDSETSVERRERVQRDNLL